MTLVIRILATTALALAACGGDDGGDDSGGGTMNDGGDGMDAGPGEDGPADDGMDDAMDDGGGGALGDDCSSNSDCEEDFCLMIESMGQQINFCSRQCVSADDCPEEGWVCNLSPFTACVPDSG